jgi:glucokinase
MVADMKILAADIGGTNSRFALFESGGAEDLSLTESRWLKTADSKSFGHLLELLGETPFPIAPREADVAVIAVAGPVEGEVCSSPSYIPWDIDLSRAREDHGLKRALLVNDFVAQAFATRSPIGESAREILPGDLLPDGTVGVVGAGTALGQAALVPDGAGGFVAVPSEGGHGHFPFVTREECRFQEFLTKLLGEEELTVNMVVSGRGLSHIHHFLAGEDLEPKDVTAGWSLDSETLAWAARFYGRVCRDYALEILTRGGIYIAGGVAARSPELLTHPAFAREFRTSRTMGKILGRIPVFLITDQESGLWGAALLGRQTLLRTTQPRRRS